MDEIYKTKNLFVASYLMASGKVQFLGTERVNPKTKFFKFSPSSIALELENEYFSGGALPVKNVFAEYDNLRDILFSDKPNDLA